MNRLDQWIFNSYSVTPEGLGLYRIAYALFALLLIAPGHGAYTTFAAIGQFPDAFFLPPPGPMMLFSGFPSSEVLHGLVFLLNLSLVALLFGYRTRWASLLTGLLFLLGFGFSYSFGKINHTLLFVLVPVVMVASNWGAAYSVDAQQGRTRDDGMVQSWPVMLLALLLGFGMFTAGFTKLLGGWLDPATNAVQGHFVKQFYTYGRQDFLAPLLTTVHNAFFWELLDYATVLFEIGFLAAVLSPRTTRLFAAVAVCFHICTVLVLNIAFLENLIVYAAFLDWSRWRMPDAIVFHSLRRPGLVLPLMLTLAISFFVIGSPLLWLDRYVTFSSDLTVTEVLAQLAALSLVLVLAVRLLRTRLTAHRPAFH